MDLEFFLKVTPRKNFQHQQTLAEMYFGSKRISTQRNLLSSSNKCRPEYNLPSVSIMHHLPFFEPHVLPDLPMKKATHWPDFCNFE